MHFIFIYVCILPGLILNERIANAIYGCVYQHITCIHSLLLSTGDGVCNCILFGFFLNPSSTGHMIIIHCEYATLIRKVFRRKKFKPVLLWVIKSKIKATFADLYHLTEKQKSN